MRTEEFLEEGSSLGSPVQTQKKQDVTTLLKKVLNQVANTDKNNGLMYIIRINKKPELMGQSVYD